MNPILIVGPCAAESQIQLTSTLSRLQDCFAKNSLEISYFRAGVWKPRSTPDTFTGLGALALPWLKKIETDFHVRACLEVATPEHVRAALAAGLRHFWIGSRTAVNPFLVQELADTLKGNAETVMVKNPMTPDLNLWLGNIERFQKAGIPNVLAIHRGFADNRETLYRNNPLWEIPIELKLHLPDLPLLCDVSHLTGNPKHLGEAAQIALDYGFDGLMIESHCEPSNALSDAQQQVTPEALTDILKTLVFKSPTSSPAENALRKERNLLEHVDTQMAELLAKRMSIVDTIAEIKRENNLPIVQPKQWNKVVAKYQDAALQDEQYQEFIKKFLELLHQYSVARQRNGD